MLVLGSKAILDDMITYELTPNIKTKSYRVLEDGVELVRNLSKKAALLFVNRLNGVNHDVSSDLCRESREPVGSNDEENSSSSNSDEQLRNRDLRRQSDQFLEESIKAGARAKEARDAINATVSKLADLTQLKLRRARSEAQVFSQSQNALDPETVDVYSISL